MTQTTAKTTLSSVSIHVALALLRCAGLACGDEEPRAEILPPIVVMQVAQSGTFEDRWFPGRAKATREANIAFEVPGRLIERPVEVGDVVGKGQLRAKALQDSELFAPFDGTVSSILVENFENVQARQVTMRVLDTSKIEMVIDIPETLAPNVPHVKAVRVRFAALPGREFPAKIIEVSNEASEATRTYPVNLLMEQPADVEILPGMAGEASGWVAVPGEETGQSLEVRISALSTDDNQKSYVWVVDPEAQTVHRREVEVGETISRGVVVRGLERGEWVAIAGTQALRDGQKVRILERIEQEGPG